MFLNMLTEAQKKAFLAIAMKIIGADGLLDPRERQMIEGMRYEMGLWNETDLPKGSIEELAKPFDTRQSRVTLMLEGIALAYVDEEYTSEEEKILRALALVFELSEEEAAVMENWVLRYKDLIKEATAMFSK
jgi:tellurite resistance protein